MNEISRRQAMRWMGGGGAALATALFGNVSVRTLAAQDADLVGEVTVALMDTIREAEEGAALPTGPFYVQGLIYPNGTLDVDGNTPEGAASIGTFRCWGWIFNGETLETFGSVVSQSFEFDDRGVIYITGGEGQGGPGPRAISGGLGDFEAARGNLSPEPINPANFTFRAAFNFS